MSGLSKAVAQVTKIQIPSAEQLNALPLEGLIEHKRLIENALETMRTHYNEVAARVESLTPRKDKPPVDEVKIIAPIGIDTVEVFGKVGK